MTKVLVHNVKKILTVMQAVEKSTAPGKSKKKAGFENELSVYRVSYLETKTQIEKAIEKLSKEDRQTLVEVYKEDFTFCRVAIEGRVEDGKLPDVTNMVSSSYSLYPLLINTVDLDPRSKTGRCDQDGQGYCGEGQGN